MSHDNNGEGAPTPETTPVQDVEEVETSAEQAPSPLEMFMSTMVTAMKMGEDMVRITGGWATAFGNEVVKSSKLFAKAGEVQGAIMAEKMGQLMEGKIPEYDPSVLSSASELSRVYSETFSKAMKDMSDHYIEQTNSMTEALATGDWTKVEDELARYAAALDTVNNVNPELMEEAKEKTGFNVENENEYTLLMETPRAKVWQVLPLEEGVVVDDTRKPVMLVSPFMLEDRIMAIDPHNGMSFAHQFANEGIPTYVIRFDNPNENEFARDMSGEEFTDDLADATGAIKAKHGRSVALQTVCQGAYLSLLSMCSGRLDESVDAFTQIVPPNGQTEDPILQSSLQRIPESDRGHLPEVDPFPASVSTLSMQLNNLQNPVSSLIGAINAAKKGPMSSSAAAMNVWLESHETRPMPRKMVELTLQGAVAPVSPEGVLPQRLYGEELSLQRMRNKKWGIFAGGRDNVVSPVSARAPLGLPCFAEEPLTDVVYVEDPKAGHVSFLTGYTTKQGREKNPNNPLSLYRKWEEEEREEEARRAIEEMPLAA